jgi:hypothetical protein
VHAAYGFGLLNQKSRRAQKEEIGMVITQWVATEELPTTLTGSPGFRAVCKVLSKDSYTPLCRSTLSDVRPSGPSHPEGVPQLESERGWGRER